MTLGSLWLALHQKTRHGLKAAWYRDVVRPKILSTAPIDDTTDGSCEIHVLTSQQDWLNLIWTLKSFYIASNRRYALCIHEDGSLSSNELSAIAKHFPRARIIRRAEADDVVNYYLNNYPLSRTLRNTNVLAPKIFDFIVFLEAERMALLDSDLLFFSEPKSYLDRVESAAYKFNTFNADIDDGYTIDRNAMSALVGYDVAARVNTGLGLVHRASVRWEWTEEFLGLPGILSGNFWRVEQTLFALCSSRFGVELLPHEYDLSLKPGIYNKPFRHYVGGIRHLMYSEGMAYLKKAGFLKQLQEP